MATPAEHVSRDYQAFLRGPSTSSAFAFGTVAALRSGVWHAPQILSFPAPSDSSPDDFGIMESGNFTVEIADEPNDADWYLLQEDFTRILLEDGSGALIMDY